MEKKKKPGGQRGNQNARIHGFYSKVMDAAERRNLTVANDIDGIDNEIAVLRVKIRNVLAKEPGNIKLIMAAITTLAGLLKARAALNKDQKKSLKESMGNMLQEIAAQIGAQAVSTLITKKIG
jgi:hypothetical protein